MKAWMKRALALLAALCLLAGTIVALSEGLLTEDAALVDVPVPEEIETDLWTEDMQTAGEQAVAGASGDTGLTFTDQWGPNKSTNLIVLNVPDPVMAAASDGSYRESAELEINMPPTAVLTSIVSSDESVATVQVVEGSEALSTYSYSLKVKVTAVKKGTTMITATTSLGFSKSIEFNVVPFEYLPIDEALFPDPAFRRFLVSFFHAEDDNLISSSVRLSTKKIDYDWNSETYLKDAGILNFKGIEYFPALEVLYLGGGKFESLDLSKNTKLEVLDLSYCSNLKNLNISGCVNLEALQCPCCALTSLDVSHCTDLYVLVCDQNNISSLNVTNCTKLRVLKANYNKLTSLDVSHCPELLELYCYYNDIGALNITGCPTLIRCFENGGPLNENYSYTTVRGNDFSNTKKVLSNDRYKTSIRIGDVVHAHLTPTAAPTAAPTAKPTAKPTATPTAKPPRAVIEEPTDTVIYKNGTYKLDKSGNYATFVKPAISAKTVKIVDQVTISGNKVPVTAIAAKAFYKDKKLATVTIGKNVWDVGANAFCGCVKLKSVKGGAAMDRIGKNAFRGCVALTAFTLNEQVSIIGDYAFYGCSKLKVFTVKTSLLESNYIGKKAFEKLYAKVVFKCPKAKLKAYKVLFRKKGAPKKAQYK